MARNFFAGVRRFFSDYLATMSSRGPFGQLVQRATSDPAVRKQLVADPRATLAEAGVQLPEGLKVEVLENTDTVIHLVLPPFAETQP